MEKWRPDLNATTQHSDHNHLVYTEINRAPDTVVIST